MAETSWIGLSARERALLLDALAALRRSNLDDPSNIDALTIKLVHSAPHPDITVGVHGGQVQWTLGNPVPDPRVRLRWSERRGPSGHRPTRATMPDLVGADRRTGAVIYG